MATADNENPRAGRAARRLAAILIADIVGYSRLMGMDEEGTLDAFKRGRRDLLDPKVSVQIVEFGSQPVSVISSSEAHITGREQLSWTRWRWRLQSPAGRRRMI